MEEIEGFGLRGRRRAEAIDVANPLQAQMMASDSAHPPAAAVTL